MAGLVPDINPDDRVFDYLKAITIAMDVMRGPSHFENEELLKQFQDALSSRNTLGDVHMIVKTVDNLVRAAFNEGANHSELENVKLATQRAAKARSAKARDSELIDVIISEVMVRYFPSLKDRTLRKGITIHGIANKIYSEVLNAVNARNIRQGSKKVFGPHAVRKRVGKLIKNWTSTQSSNNLLDD
jgi:hypothetical protein